jgi:dTDP-4-dehydrorhamnose 3,5-epimerase
MDFEPTRIPEVLLIRPEVFGDSRGFFLESWHEAKFSAGGIEARFVQDNHSRSMRHTLRGLHYQVERPQGKLVRVVTGEVYDVAVDLRRTSATFGRWVGVILNATTHEMLWVPPGFAHGFLVLSETADFVYKCTEFYVPEWGRALRWNDPRLSIDWPLPQSVAPILSRKDAEAPGFLDAECFP